MYPLYSPMASSSAPLRSSLNSASFALTGEVARTEPAGSPCFTPHHQYSARPAGLPVLAAAAYSLTPAGHRVTLSSLLYAFTPAALPRQSFRVTLHFYNFFNPTGDPK